MGEIGADKPGTGGDRTKKRKGKEIDRKEDGKTYFTTI